MEISLPFTRQQLLHRNFCCSAPIFPSRASSVPIPSHVSPRSHPSKSFSKLVVVKSETRRQRGTLGPLYASGAEAPPAGGERWLLEPVGDGDSRHLGSKVEMPGAFEIASDVVTVGRLPEKADMVIPVATVSGLHARIQKKGEYLLVTDLDSMNGTFIDEKRLKPGAASIAPSGGCVIFGDRHLAMFRVSKLDNVESPTDAGEP